MCKFCFRKIDVYIACKANILQKILRVRKYNICTNVVIVIISTYFLHYYQLLPHNLNFYVDIGFQKFIYFQF